MALIKITHKGDFRKSEGFMKRALRKDYMKILHEFGEVGVALLRQATPKESGETADSWDYLIDRKNGTVTLAWTNSHESRGLNIAILIIYGHATGNGGYVEGNDFVTPAIRDLFGGLADRVWKEVTR